MKLETIQSQGSSVVHHSLTGPLGSAQIPQRDLFQPVGAVESLSYKLGTEKVLDMFKAG